MSRQHCVPVILTRAKAQAERFAEGLPDGTRPVFSPLLEIAFLPLSSAISADEVLLLTSENGVAALVAAGGGHPGQRALCVGDRTATAAAAAGFNARSAHGAADALIDLAAQQRGPFVHVRGVHTRGDIKDRLAAIGTPVREAVLYTQDARDLTTEAQDILGSDAPALVPLFSPRTAHLFQSACPRAENASVICLSQNVANAVQAGAYKACLTAGRPDATALQDLLHQHLKAIHLETRGASG